ncbi:MAG: Hsp20/alpha crystallin family protein [Actinomycetota bacterium]|nr:Hsp20/alpha crystallin family protein [Actinomycetota bacterium]
MPAALSRPPGCARAGDVLKVPVPRRRDDAAAHPRRPSPGLLGDLPSDLTRLVEDVDGVFRTLDRAARDVVPLADLEERDDRYVLDVEFPGVQRDDVQVEITGGRLVVTGERRERERRVVFRSRTRTTGRLRLEVALPAEVEGDAVTASLDAGVLTVVVPKAPGARRRRIPVGRGGE